VRFDSSLTVYRSLIDIFRQDPGFSCCSPNHLLPRQLLSKLLYFCYAFLTVFFFSAIFRLSPSAPPEDWGPFSIKILFSSRSTLMALAAHPVGPGALPLNFFFPSSCAPFPSHMSPSCLQRRLPGPFSPYYSF